MRRPVERPGVTTSLPFSMAIETAGRLLFIAGQGPVDPVTGREITGFTENGWVGLSLLHGLFALEHNAICDALRKRL